MKINFDKVFAKSLSIMINNKHSYYNQKINYNQIQINQTYNQTQIDQTTSHNIDYIMYTSCHSTLE